mgnify:CR=1 FL=1
MALYLNQQKINGQQLKVAVVLALASEDLSGQSSFAEAAETGDKPKAMTVSMVIRYKQAADLTAMLGLAEAKDSVGERVIYNVVNDTARAMGIRRVRFQGDLNVRENDGNQMWNVSFKLSEMRSVPEIKEARTAPQAVTDQPPTVPTVAAQQGFAGVLDYVAKATAL